MTTRLVERLLGTSAYSEETNDNYLFIDRLDRKRRSVSLTQKLCLEGWHIFGKELGRLSKTFLAALRRSLRETETTDDCRILCVWLNESGRTHTIRTMLKVDAEKMVTTNQLESRIGPIHLKISRGWIVSPVIRDGNRLALMLLPNTQAKTTVTIKGQRRADKQKLSNIILAISGQNSGTLDAEVNLTSRVFSAPQIRYFERPERTVIAAKWDLLREWPLPDDDPFRVRFEPYSDVASQNFLSIPPGRVLPSNIATIWNQPIDLIAGANAGFAFLPGPNNGIYTTLTGSFSMRLDGLDELGVPPRRKIICGLSGTEYVDVKVSSSEHQESDFIEFSPDGPAFFDGTNLTDTYKTAHIRFWGDTEDLVYCSQGNSPFYLTKRNNSGFYDVFANRVSVFEGLDDFFPYAPPWNELQGEELEFANRIQTSTVKNKRLEILKSYGGSLLSVSGQQEALTIHGWLGKKNGTWKTLTVARSRDKDGVLDVELDVNTSAQLDAQLDSSELFVVTKDAESFGLDNGVISVSNWRISLENYPGSQSLFILKSGKRSIRDLAADSSTPMEESIRSALNTVVSKYENATETDYEGLRNALTSANWNGFLALNVRVPKSNLPLELRILGNNIQDSLPVHHIGCAIARAEFNQNGAQLNDSSIFGLIKYPFSDTFSLTRSKSAARSHKSPHQTAVLTGKRKSKSVTSASSKSSKGTARSRKAHLNTVPTYNLESIKVLFSNSKIQDFQSTLRVTDDQFFHEQLIGNRSFVLFGHYEKHGEEDKYTFYNESVQRLNFASRSCIETAELKQARLNIEALPNAQYACRIDTIGSIKIRVPSAALVRAEEVEDPLPYDVLGFLNVGYSFEVKENGDIVQGGGLKFDLSRAAIQQKDNIARPNSPDRKWVDDMPADIAGFVGGSPTAPLNMRDLGFEPLGTEIDHTSISWGVQFQMNLGGLGILSKVADFLVDVLVGWSKDLGRFIMGMRKNGSYDNLTIGIQNALAIRAQKVQLYKLANDTFVLKFKGCYLDVVGKSLPSNDRPSFYIASKKRVVSWYFGYVTNAAAPTPKDAQTILVCANKFKIQKSFKHSENQMASVMQLLLENALYLGDDSQAGASSDQEFVAGMNRADIVPDQSIGWLVAAYFRSWADRFGIGVMFKEPDLFGLYLDMFGQQYQVIYRQINDNIGVYEFYVQLSSSLSFKLAPIAANGIGFGVAIYSNGDWRVDFGFPVSFDFSGSLGFKFGPFSGLGGIYIGRLSQATSQWKSLSGTVWECGLGLRVAFGRSIRIGNFLKAGYSLGFFGVLHGALGKGDYGADGLTASSWFISGTIGCIGELYASIDFGIISAKINIKVFIACGASFGKDKDGGTIPLVLTFDAGVDVVAVLVIDIRIWRFRYRKEIKLHYQWQIHESLTIGPRSAGGSIALRRSLAWRQIPNVIVGSLSVKFVPHVAKTFSGTSSSLQAIPLLWLDEENLRLLVESILLWIFKNSGEDTDTNRTAEFMLSWSDEIAQILDVPVTLAHPDTSNPVPSDALTYDIISDFLQRLHLNVTDGADSSLQKTVPMTFFPVLPEMDCQEQWTGGTKDHSFSQGQSTPDFEAKHAEFLSKYSIIDIDRKSVPTINTSKPFSELIVQDYFDVLAKTSIAYLKDWLGKNEDTDSKPARDWFSELSEEALQGIDARLNNLFLGGQRINSGGKEMGVFQATGQQFDLQFGRPDYRLSLRYNGASAKAYLQENVPFFTTLKDECTLDTIQSGQVQILPGTTVHPRTYSVDVPLILSGLTSTIRKPEMWKLSSTIMARAAESPLSVQWSYTADKEENRIPVGALPSILLELELESPPSSGSLPGFYGVKNVSEATRDLLNSISLEDIPALQGSALVSSSSAGIDLSVLEDGAIFSIVNLTEYTRPPSFLFSDSVPPECRINVSKASDLLYALKENAKTNRGGLFVYLPNYTFAGTIGTLWVICYDPAGVPPAETASSICAWHNVMLTNGLRSSRRADPPSRGLMCVDHSRDVAEISFEPGSLGLVLNRIVPPVPSEDSPPDVLAHSSFFRLYNLLDLQVVNDSMGILSDVHTELHPVRPEQARQNNYRLGAPSLRRVDEHDWLYRFIWPLSKFVAGGDNPYDIVGKTFTLNLCYRDIYGNRPESSRNEDSPFVFAYETPEILYSDPIVSLNELPAFGFSYTLVEEQNRPALKLTFTFDKQKYSDSHFEPETQIEHRRLFKRAHYQFATSADYPVTAAVHCDLFKYEPVVDLTALSEFLYEIADSNFSPTTSSTDLLVEYDDSEITDSPHAELKTILRIERKEKVPVDCHSRVRSTACEIPLGDRTLSTLEQVLQQAFQHSAVKWLLATCGNEIWCIKESILSGFAANGNFRFFATPPLSTKPWSGSINYSTFRRALRRAVAPLSTVEIRGIDADREFLRLIESIDRVLEPAALRALTILDNYWEKERPNGVRRYDHSLLTSLVNGKREMAELLSRRVAPVFADQTQSEDDFREPRALLTDAYCRQLAAGNAVDVVAQVPLNVPVTIASTRLFGTIETPNDNLVVSTAKVELGKPEANLSFTISTPDILNKISGSVNYLVTHLEIAAEASRDKPPKWLKLAKFRPLLSGIQIPEIFAPVKELPKPPTLLSQSAVQIPATADGTKTALEMARLYQAEFRKAPEHAEGNDFIGALISFGNEPADDNDPSEPESDLISRIAAYNISYFGGMIGGSLINATPLQPNVEGQNLLDAAADAEAGHNSQSIVTTLNSLIEMRDHFLNLTQTTSWAPFEQWRKAFEPPQDKLTLDVMYHQSPRLHLQTYRNVLTGRRTAMNFVMRSALVSGPAPLKPQLRADDSICIKDIEMKIGPTIPQCSCASNENTKSIEQHLKQLFEEMFRPLVGLGTPNHSVPFFSVQTSWQFVWENNETVVTTPLSRTAEAQYYPNVSTEIYPKSIAVAISNQFQKLRPELKNGLLRLSIQVFRDTVESTSELLFDAPRLDLPFSCIWPINESMGLSPTDTIVVELKNSESE